MDWVLYTATLEKYKLCASTFRQQPTQDLILSRRHLTLDNTDKLTALPTGLFTFTVLLQFLVQRFSSFHGCEQVDL